MSLEVCYKTLLNLLIFKKSVPSWGGKILFFVFSHCLGNGYFFFSASCHHQIFSESILMPSCLPQALTWSSLLEGLTFLKASQMIFQCCPSRLFLPSLTTRDRSSGSLPWELESHGFRFWQTSAPRPLSFSWAKGTLGWFLGEFCDTCANATFLITQTTELNTCLYVGDWSFR